MPDPLTLSVLGGVVLSEGVRFLYRQAEELIKAGRRRRADAGDPKPETAEVPSVPTEVLESAPPTEVDGAGLDRATDRLAELAEPLAPYARGEAAVDGGDTALLEAADRLRTLLEQVYGRSITFRGEPREAGTTRVAVEQKVGDVEGDAVGLEADSVAGPADVRVRQESGRVAADGSVTGARLGDVGRTVGPRR